MDALRCFLADGDKSKGIDDIKAMRMAIADALRDLADEIEAGNRLIVEMRTFEQFTLKGLPVSILYLASSLHQVPK